MGRGGLIIIDRREGPRKGEGYKVSMNGYS